MIFCCPKDFADELGICIVYMGLVDAREWWTGKAGRSPISKETLRPAPLLEEP